MTIRRNGGNSVVWALVRDAPNTVYRPPCATWETLPDVFPLSQIKGVWLCARKNKEQKGVLLEQCR